MKTQSALIIVISLILASCAQSPPSQTKIPIAYNPPLKVAMCADRTSSGVIHLSPCNPLGGDPR